MVFLVRRVQSAWWRSCPPFCEDEIPADVLFDKGFRGELRTVANALSFWRVSDPDDASQLADVAIAVTSKWDPIQGIGLSWLRQEELLAEGIGFQDSEGETAVRDMVERHTDAVRLDAGRLTVVALALRRSIEGNRFHEFTRIEVLDLLADAVIARRLSLDHLKQGAKTDVEARVAERRARGE